MKAILLCGGQGTRIQDVTGGLKPKPMVEVGGRPILWHIMKGYSVYGIKEFVLCLGHLGNSIKDFFLHYEALNSDVTLHLGARGEITYHHPHSEADWVVTLVDTGQNAMTGARVAKVHRFVENEDVFMLTYGDGVADINFNDLLAFHRAHGKVATITGIIPQGKFGRLNVEGHEVKAFEEKPHDESEGRINGGFMVLNRQVFEYLSTEPDCILERQPMERLASQGQLMMYPHDGFWQCMDTFRDLQLLESLWASDNPPWKTWKD